MRIRDEDSWIKRGDLKSVMGRGGSSMESGEQRFVLKVSCAQCFKELSNCWGNFKKTFNGNQVAEVSKHFTQFGILHKINIQGFNSKQSYLEKL